MSKAPAFARAAEIEASLEQLAELCEDPTPVVYKRLFELQPQMEPYFWRDTNNAIKGEMLSRTFAAILDFIGERRYADHMIETEIITHEGYDVPREVFATFFAVVRDAVRQVLGLIEILRRQQHRRPVVRELPDGAPHLETCFGVEASGRLVEHDQPRAADEAHRDVESAAHSTRVG